MIMNLPYITKDIQGIGGYIREKNEDFLVEEIPMYEPCGEGTHLYINITKNGLTTLDVQKFISEKTGIKLNDIGFAGMKDKNAITTQTISILVETIKPEEIIEKIKDSEFKINWYRLHKNKLKPGHLRGNKFEIVISGIKIPIEEAFEKCEKISEIIKEKGIPNYYGPQRFGINEDNIQKGLDIIKGKYTPKSPWMKRFLVSAYQSYLCNIYLSERIKQNKFNTLIKGDIAKKYDSGGMFEVIDLDTEQKRYENKEITFTAPIYGRKFWEATNESGEFEKQILENNTDMEKFSKIKNKGSRREGRILIPDLEVEKLSDKIKLKFSLPKGSFATNIVREFTKNDN